MVARHFSSFYEIFLHRENVPPKYQMECFQMLPILSRYTKIYLMGSDMDDKMTLKISSTDHFFNFGHLKFYEGL